MLYASIIAGVALAVIFVAPQERQARQKITLNGNELSVVVADTDFLRERGLGGYDNLPQNEGMLFIFPKPERYGFWMKGMQFPIDIIWFDEHRKVIDVWENASPASYPKVHTPEVPAQYVLEVAAGYWKNHALKEDDVLELEDTSRYTR